MPEQNQPETDVERLVQTIDDNADPLHGDFTPSVNQLIKAGWRGAQAIIKLLDAPDKMTRMRAQRVLEGVVMYCHGWRPGQGYPGDAHAAQERTRALLEANGNYQSNAQPERRKEAVERWRRWLETDAESYPCHQEKP